jgi:hypothetical protein
MSMMKSVMFIIGCGLVIILRKGKWNELTRHPKDHGKNQSNSRTNSLQPGKDDVDQDNILSFSILFELGLFVSLLFYLIFIVFYLN